MVIVGGKPPNVKFKGLEKCKLQSHKQRHNKL